MLGPVTQEALEHIVANMREGDEREIFATRWDMDDGALDRDRLVAEMMHFSAFSWVARTSDGEPAAVIGARPLWPGVWGAFAFGTPRWREVALTLTKHALRSMTPTLVEDMGAHLAFCYARADNTLARRWLERIGFKTEHIVREFGRDRSDFAFHARRA